MSSSGNRFIQPLESRQLLSASVAMPGIEPTGSIQIQFRYPIGLELRPSMPTLVYDPTYKSDRAPASPPPPVAVAPEPEPAPEPAPLPPHRDPALIQERAAAQRPVETLTWRGQTYEAHAGRWIVTLTPENATYNLYGDHGEIMDRAAEHGLYMGGVLAPLENCIYHYVYFDGTPQELDAAIAAFGAIASIAPDFVTQTPAGPIRLADRLEHEMLVELGWGDGSPHHPHPSLPDPDTHFLPADPSTPLRAAFTTTSAAAEPAAKAKARKPRAAIFIDANGKRRAVKLTVTGRDGKKVIATARIGNKTFAVRGTLTKANVIKATLTGKNAVLAGKLVLA